MRLLFDKSFMQPDDMVELLRHRGLEIENPQRVSQYIRNIGYYRLSAYMFPFLRQPKDEHRFKLGSNFQDALNLYRFDKKLRLFLFNEIEKVAIRHRRGLRYISALFVTFGISLGIPSSASHVPPTSLYYCPATSMPHAAMP